MDFVDFQVISVDQNTEYGISVCGKQREYAHQSLRAMFSVNNAYVFLLLLLALLPNSIINVIMQLPNTIGKL